MFCLENYYKIALLLGGCPLEEASEQSSHFGNKSYILLLYVPYLVNMWYVSADSGLSVLQVVFENFPGPTCCKKKNLMVAEIWVHLIAFLGRDMSWHLYIIQLSVV